MVYYLLGVLLSIGVIFLLNKTFEKYNCNHSKAQIGYTLLVSSTSWISVVIHLIFLIGIIVYNSNVLKLNPYIKLSNYWNKVNGIS